MFCTFTLHDLTRLFGDNINITCPNAQVWVGISKILFLLLLPPFDLHLIFEKSSLKHQVGYNLDFLSIWNLNFAGYTGRKISSSTKTKKNTGENGKLTFSKYPAFFITYSYKIPPNWLIGIGIPVGFLRHILCVKHWIIYYVLIYAQHLQMMDRAIGLS